MLLVCFHFEIDANVAILVIFECKMNEIVVRRAVLVHLFHSHNFQNAK